MSKNQPFSRKQVGLPDIDLIEGSEQAFSDAFLRAAQTMHHQLESLKSLVVADKDFTNEPFNCVVLGLFSKMCKHYYSYVLLAIHGDWVGSQLLIEHLTEAAITLTYLLEEGDEQFFSEYTAASVYQARYLVSEVEEQLQQFDKHADLLLLREQLKTAILKQEQTVEQSLTSPSKAYLWGPQAADTTVKRGSIMGLNFLFNPARSLALKVIPASWLDIQLNYLMSFAKSRTKEQPTDFTCLRDAAHLCLHATQALLEEVADYQGVNSSEIKYQQQILNTLYEWFHDAHRAYQLHYSMTRQGKHDYDSY